MTGLSLSLVLAAAFVHASWNFLAKRAGSGGAPFVWVFGAMSSVIYSPVVVVFVLWRHPHVTATQIAFMVGSGALHLVYFTLLQTGYRHGDLSLVYPLARGTGPLLSTAAAIAFFGERPAAVAIAGGILVCTGVFSLGRVSTSMHDRRVSSGLLFGVGTGCIIATYTLWDKHVVTSLAAAPLLLDWASNVVRTALLTPFALSKRSEVARVWRSHRREASGVAVLAPLAYILVLTALAVTPVSYIAPAREVSILVGTFLGARVLKEGSTRARMVGALLIVGGLAALALA